MSNVKPGMLAYVTNPKGIPLATPEIIGRVVYVKCASDPDMKFPTVEGRILNGCISNGVVWVVSSNTPLPVRHGDALFHMYERPLRDVILRPLSDPDLGVSDSEVRDIYSPVEEKVSQ